MRALELDCRCFGGAFGDLWLVLGTRTSKRLYVEQTIQSVRPSPEPRKDPSDLEVSRSFRLWHLVLALSVDVWWLVIGPRILALSIDDRWLMIGSRSSALDTWSLAFDDWWFVLGTRASTLWTWLTTLGVSQIPSLRKCGGVEMR